MGGGCCVVTGCAPPTKPEQEPPRHEEAGLASEARVAPEPDLEPYAAESWRALSAQRQVRKRLTNLGYGLLWAGFTVFWAFCALGGFTAGSWKDVATFGFLTLVGAGFTLVFLAGAWRGEGS